MKGFTDLVLLAGDDNTYLRERGTRVALALHMCSKSRLLFQSTKTD